MLSRSASVVRIHSLLLPHSQRREQPGTSSVERWKWSVHPFPALDLDHDCEAAMTPRPPRRIRRTLLILGACWIALGTAWGARRWWAVRILEKAEAAGNVVTWEQPLWADPNWSRLLPLTRLRDIDVRARIANGRELAWAVRTCGGLERLSVSEREETDDDTPAFLRRLGPQPRLRSLSIASYPLTDEETPLFLGGFPHLYDLSLSGGKYSGANFPHLGWLRAVNFQSMPFSDAGLAGMLRCPDLFSCTLIDTEITPAGVQWLAQQKPKWLEEFILYSRRIPNAEAPALLILLKNECPKLKARISGPDAGAE
jgi:hypothetical protein